MTRFRLPGSDVPREDPRAQLLGHSDRPGHEIPSMGGSFQRLGCRPDEPSHGKKP